MENKKLLKGNFVMYPKYGKVILKNGIPSRHKGGWTDVDVEFSYNQEKELVTAVYKDKNGEEIGERKCHWNKNLKLILSGLRVKFHLIEEK